MNFLPNLWSPIWILFIGQLLCVLSQLCPRNEVYVTPCRWCDVMCSTRHNPICSHTTYPACLGPGCSCFRGFVRDDSNGTCVFASFCPKLTAKSRRTITRMTSATTDARLGVIQMVEDPLLGDVRISGTIKGLTDLNGQKLRDILVGMHIHEYGDMLHSNCSSAGGHWNPLYEQHGGPANETRHIGDLGNIYIDNRNAASVRITIKNTSLPLIGTSGIVGRTLVIHEREDDLGMGFADGSSTTGNSGNRIACGVIGIGSEDATTWEPGEGTKVKYVNYPTIAEKYREAIAILTSGSINTDDTRVGELSFIQELGSGIVEIVGVINLPQRNGTSNSTQAESLYGLSIHELGDLTQQDCTSGGRHYNPAGQLARHGLPIDKNDNKNNNKKVNKNNYVNLRHFGDIGNVVVEANGYGLVEMQLDSNDLPLVGPYSIVGRLLVLHENEDTGTETADLGEPVACGVIGIRSGFSPADPSRNLRETQKPLLKSNVERVKATNYFKCLWILTLVKLWEIIC